jgi:hypothetical protein
MSKQGDGNTQSWLLTILKIINTTLSIITKLLVLWGIG